MSDQGPGAPLAESQGRLLPRLARAEVARALGVAAALGAAADPGVAPAPFLAEWRATFVTLTCDGALRGCVGRLEPTRPLLADLEGNARAAAFEDPRFAPLSAAELPRTGFGVSVLSPLVPLAVGSREELLAALVPGRDGLVLSWREHRATFLPQVWADLRRPADFLAHLELKAGLPPGFWSDEIALATYSVQSWSELPVALAPAPLRS